MSYVRIYCNQINPLWKHRDVIHSAQTTDVWRINVRDSHAIPENILSTEERLKASRFLHNKDRDSYTSRRAALRILLSRYLDIPAPEIEFITGVNKKPEIKAQLSSIQFNLSHSGDQILIAISDKAVGVDIERIDPDFNFSDILKHSFSEQEIEYMEQKGNRRELFFKLWTRKEALTKASSKGLDDDLSKIPCLDGSYTSRTELIGLEGTWNTSSFSINKEYECTIACLAGQKLNFLNFDF
ncbi:MAG: 4'-phosphopantetheinyl transferase superfamily protein [Pedobacter sp.]|jgi:4'-phosphopantetheinyl transferase